MPKGDKLKLKADPDDGTTPISNLLLEAVAIADLNGTEKGLILYLWRQTYGWLINGQRPKEATLGQDTLAAAFSNSPRSIYASLRSLTEKKILLRRDLGQGKGYMYRMNTNVAQWNSHSIDLDILKKVAGVESPIKGSQFLLPSTETSTLPSTETSTLPSTETSTLPSTETSGPTLYKEIKEKKEILKKEPTTSGKKYGEFKNVLLTDKEYEKLEIKLGSSLPTYITKLSEGIASHGYKYKSHYATILTWKRNDDEKQKSGGQYGGQGTGVNKPNPKAILKAGQFTDPNSLG